MNSKIIPADFREKVTGGSAHVVEDETHLLTPVILLDRSIAFHNEVMRAAGFFLPQKVYRYHWSQVMDLKELYQERMNEQAILRELRWVQGLFVDLLNHLPLGYFAEMEPHRFDQLQEFIDCITSLCHGKVSDRRELRVEA